MLVSSLDVAVANSRRIIEYGYDDSGDIIAVDAEVSEQPPLVTALTPSTVRLGQQLRVLAEGVGLRQVQIDADSSGLVVSDIQSDNIRAEFTLNVGQQATLGEHTLTFSTPLGFTSRTITVLPPLPEITLYPAPIALPASGASFELDIQLSRDDVIEHTLDLSVDDPSVAELNISSISIPAGSTRTLASVEISGLQNGTTTLNITSATLDDYSTRIFVTDAYVAATGDHSAFADPLGIVRQETLLPPPLPVRGPFSARIGILKSQSDAVGDISVKPLMSPLLTIAKGAVITGISQAALISDGEAVEVTVQGFGLENVDNAAIFPPDGVTVSSLTVSPDGSHVTFTVTVEPGVDLGVVQIVLTQQGNEVFTTNFTPAKITIAQGLPEIETIDPIVVTRLSKHSLTVRGSHFESARTLKITPADGITIASPMTVNADGTQITAQIAVDELAPLGERVVSVETDAGVTGGEPTPANTLSVINGPAKEISFLTAPMLGVLKSIAPVDGTRDVDIRENRVGVVYGSHVGSLSPASQPVGADFTLTIHGSGLTDAVSVSFIPDDNIFVGIPTVADDGLSLTVPVAIDADAAKTLRRVVVETPDSTIAASPATADRFQVTDLRPAVTSLSPNFLVAGADFVSLKIRGHLLIGVTSVFAVPGDDILIGPPAVNADGTEVTVDIKADSGAQTDIRVIVVETAGGVSSDIPTPANSLHIVSNQPTAFNALVSALLGVEKTSATPPQPERNLLIASSLLGIIREKAPPPDTPVDLDQHAGPLGVLLGPAAINTNPRLAPIGSMLTLTIDGVGLDQVTDLSLNPPEGLTLTENFSVSPDGDRLTVPVQIAADADLTRREIVLTTATGEKLPFVDIEESRLFVTGLLPIIQSIEPIQEFPGATPTLVVRGFNLNNAVAIGASPGGGDISFGSISANADGTVLQAPMVISPSAESGPRVITVTTLAGTSESQATPANTFTVLPLP